MERSLNTASASSAARSSLRQSSLRHPEGLQVVAMAKKLDYRDRRRGSWNRDPVQVALGGAVVERVNVTRRTGYRSQGVDPTRSWQAGYFLLGTKSARRDRR